MDQIQFQKSKYKNEIKSVVIACDSLRKGQNNLDVSFEQFINKKWGISLDALYQDLGVNPSVDTIENLFTLPDESVRFLIPEIIRDALRLGLRRSPIWPDNIAAEQQVSQLSFIQPHLNMSDAGPHYVGEAETIPTGTISFGQKTVKVRKMGRGIKIPDEVKNYVSLNVVAIYLQDFGVKLGQAIDTLMIDILINGEQTDGSESAPVVGVDTTATLTYKDLLRVWIRMARIGRVPLSIIAGENMAIETLNLTEFKTNQFGTRGAVGVPTSNALDIKTPIPSRTLYYIHGSVPTDQSIILDPGAAIIKYNAQPLLVETERIVSNQTEATYATLTTGFGIVFRDGRVIVDKSLDIDSAGFPSYMDVDAIEAVTIED